MSEVFVVLLKWIVRELRQGTPTVSGKPRLAPTYIKCLPIVNGKQNEFYCYLNNKLVDITEAAEKGYVIADRIMSNDSRVFITEEGLKYLSNELKSGKQEVLGALTADKAFRIYQKLKVKYKYEIGLLKGIEKLVIWDMGAKFGGGITVRMRP